GVAGVEIAREKLAAFQEFDGGARTTTGRFTTQNRISVSQEKGSRHSISAGSPDCGHCHIASGPAWYQGFSMGTNGQTRAKPAKCNRRHARRERFPGLAV